MQNARAKYTLFYFFYIKKTGNWYILYKGKQWLYTKETWTGAQFNLLLARCRRVGDVLGFGRHHRLRHRRLSIGLADDFIMTNWWRCGSRYADELRMRTFNRSGLRVHCCRLNNKTQNVELHISTYYFFYT